MARPKVVMVNRQPRISDYHHRQQRDINESLDRQPLSFGYNMTKSSSHSSVQWASSNNRDREAGSYAGSKAAGGTRRRRGTGRRRKCCIYIGRTWWIHERGLKIKFDVMVAQNVEAVRLYHLRCCVYFLRENCVHHLYISSPEVNCLSNKFSYPYSFISSSWFTKCRNFWNPSLSLALYQDCSRVKLLQYTNLQ